MKNPWFLYILSNYTRNVLYVGITNDLPTRLANHREGIDSNFVPRSNLKYLVYWEELPDKRRALKREKQLKGWHREWKFALIRKKNPEMRDLSGEIPGPLIDPD